MLSKTLELDDYKAISEGHGKAIQGMAALYGIGQYIYIPHDHRHWEYGSAMQAILDHGNIHSALDIGCGDGFLGPAIAMLGINTIECDPIEEVIDRRETLGTKLNIELTSQDWEIATLPSQYTCDVVTCISVIEHLKRPQINDALDKLASLANKLLFITTDIGEGNEWHNHRERETHFSMDDIGGIVDHLRSKGFSIDLDPVYHGNEVKGYSFVRLVGTRNE